MDIGVELRGQKREKMPRLFVLSSRITSWFCLVVFNCLIMRRTVCSLECPAVFDKIVKETRRVYVGGGAICILSQTG